MDAEPVEFIKGVQNSILEIVIAELEADNEQVYQDWQAKATLPTAALATLNHEDDNTHRAAPLAKNKYEVIARLAELGEQFPYLQPVYDTYAPYCTPAEHDSPKGSSFVQDVCDIS